jgi:hypothetical protein
MLVDRLGVLITVTGFRGSTELETIDALSIPRQTASERYPVGVGIEVLDAVECATYEVKGLSQISWLSSIHQHRSHIQGLVNEGSGIVDDTLGMLRGSPLAREVVLIEPKPGGEMIGVLVRHGNEINGCGREPCVLQPFPGDRLVVCLVHRHILLLLEIRYPSEAGIRGYRAYTVSLDAPEKTLRLGLAQVKDQPGQSVYHWQENKPTGY